MAVARALARPLWTCNSCRAKYLRAFTSATRDEFPRHRPGRATPSVIDIARSNLRDTEPLPEFESDVTQSYTPAPSASAWIMEGREEGDESQFLSKSSQKASKKSLAESSQKASKKNKKAKAKRSDGISNLQNEVDAQDLKIPSQFLSKEEAPRWQTVRDDFQQRPQQKEQQDTLRKDPKRSEEPMSNVPWYLQKEYSPPARNTTAESGPTQHVLPPLPKYPPPQLEPILQYLFHEGGLDDLTILDLRKLDPPPALGSNLIMVLGTARSDKHLMGTAQRFCAHARRTWTDVAPVADGLVGRNEMKIKEKRRARRAKAFANAGVDGARLALEGVDDGMSTDWICVHVGRIEPDPEQPKSELKSVELERIGFGQESDKITLVVQMFTEDKREAVGLENLWNTIMERNLRKQAYRDGTLPLPGAEGEEAVLEDGQEEGEDDGSLTSQEKKARKRFKLAKDTVLRTKKKNFTPWPEELVQEEPVQQQERVIAS